MLQVVRSRTWELKGLDCDILRTKKLNGVMTRTLIGKY